MPRTKESKARIKAAGPADGLAEGQFRALVSVFGNEDSMGDVIAPGAFAQVLAEWKASGDPIPVVWSHKWGDAFAHIGSVLEATETADGLEVLAQIEDMDTNPTAKHVHGLLKGRRIKQFSFAYDVGEGGWVETDDTVNHPWGEFYEIKRFSSLFEVGPCLVGANQQTDLLAAKAADLARGAKAGRVLSQANYDALASAHASIGDVLAAATPEKNRRTETSPPEPGGATPVQDTGQQPPEETAAVTPAAAKSPALTPAQVAAWVTTQELMTMRSTG
ncbi:HK97 family phage prohead protease [Streptomyces niveus]|uniref:HK97 family phage prohead protease n=1 Tax=Streptomyces niveus TaxID=193462 RepID=UPI0036D848BC